MSRNAARAGFGSVGRMGGALNVAGETASHPSMSSAADSRVRTSASQESVPAWTERSPVFGGRCGGLLASFDPATLSWRTSQACWISGWAKWSATFPGWGMTRNGRLYPLAPLGPHTHESACSLWPTPTQVDGKHPGRRKWKSHQQLALSLAVNLDQQRRGLPTGQVSPTFREWLMGYPIAWTEAPRSATASSRRSRSGSPNASRKPKSSAMSNQSGRTPGPP